MSYSLSSGAIERIFHGEKVENPIFQVLGHKKILSNDVNSAERYRLLISDGLQHFSSVMLSTQLSNLVTEGKMIQNSIIQVSSFQLTSVGVDKHILIILEVKILSVDDKVMQRIGDPTPFKPTEMPIKRTSSELGTNSDQTSSFHKQTSSIPSFEPKKYCFAQSVESVKDTNLVGKVHSISSLNPYQNKWTIRARVTQKTDIKTWSNSRGEGKLFSMTLTDETSEIRATCFNEECDRVFPISHVGQIYYVTKATLKVANKQYSSLPNDYEMTFTRETQLIPCEEKGEDINIPEIDFNFVKINKLSDYPINKMVDILGVVHSVGQINSFTSKQNKEMKKRDIQIVDDSGYVITMTIWGDQAERFSIQEDDQHPTVAIKGARISNFNGCSLSVGSNSTLSLHPERRDAYKLAGWYLRGGAEFEFVSMAGKNGESQVSARPVKWKTFGECSGENVDGSEYYTVKATLIFLRKESCIYQACPAEDCNKKLIDQGNGIFRCEKCQRDWPNYKRRFMLQTHLADHTDSQWVTCFHNTAEKILCCSVENIADSNTGSEGQDVEDVIQKVMFCSYVFRMRSRMEVFNYESRLKSTVISVDSIDYVGYAKHLLEEIRALLC